MTDRRSFLRALAASAAAAPLAPGESKSDKLGATLPTRLLGHTGERICAFTLGGSHCSLVDSDKTAQEIIETAIELGVRSFDNARNYGEGNAEVLYGKFLTPRFRDEIFLTTKTSHRTAAQVRLQLEESLRTMKTDRLDLWQIHAIGSPEDVDRRIENGVLEEFLKAKEEGKVRYIGFTGHSSYHAHLHMLKRLRERGLKLDTCLMPINLIDPAYDSYIVNVLPELLKENYGIFAMKTLAGGTVFGVPPAWDRDKPNDLPSLTQEVGITVQDMHRYVYSLPVASLVSGCESAAQVRENIATLTQEPALDPETRDELLEKAKPFAGQTFEYYKKPRA